MVGYFKKIHIMISALLALLVLLVTLLFCSYEATVPTLVVGDREMLSEIFVTKFKNFSDRTLAQTAGSDVWKKAILNLSGDEWKKARSIITPAPTATKLKNACQ